MPFRTRAPGAWPRAHVTLVPPRSTARRARAQACTLGRAGDRVHRRIPAARARCEGVPSVPCGRTRGAVAACGHCLADVEQLAGRVGRPRKEAEEARGTPLEHPVKRATRMAGPHARPCAHGACMAPRACHTHAVAAPAALFGRRALHGARMAGPSACVRARAVCLASRSGHLRAVSPRGSSRARRPARLGGPVTVCTAVLVSVSGRVACRASDSAHCGSLGGARGVRRAGDSVHRGSPGPHTRARVPSRAKGTVRPRPVQPQPQADVSHLAAQIDRRPGYVRCARVAQSSWRRASRMYRRVLLRGVRVGEASHPGPRGKRPHPDGPPILRDLCPRTAASGDASWAHEAVRRVIPREVATPLAPQDGVQYWLAPQDGASGGTRPAQGGPPPSPGAVLTTW